MKKFFSIFLIFCLLFGFVTPVFANEYPELPSPPISDGYPYYIVYDQFGLGADQVRCYTFSSSDMVRNIDTGTVTLSVSDQIMYFNLVYSSSQGYYWARQASITSNKWQLPSEAVILEKNFTIYNNDGSIFPPVPPLLTLVAELVAVQGQVLQAEVVGAMMTLVPYGISLLALLISLPVLLIVLRRFLP